MKFLLGHAFDAWNNLRYCVKEALKEMDDALDVWGSDD